MRYILDLRFAMQLERLGSEGPRRIGVVHALFGRYSYFAKV